MIKSSKSSEHLSLHVPSTHVPPCLVISFTRISRGPSTHKSGSLNNKYEYHSTLSKHSRKISCQCTNPFHHLVRATPKTTRKPFRGHGRRCRPRPPWPLQRSAARPRRRGLPEPPNAAASGLGRRGCDAEGAAAATAVEKQGVAMGCFSGWLGKILNTGHRKKICQAATFSVRHWGENKSNHRK